MDEKIIQLQTKTLSLVDNALDKVAEMSCMTFRDVDGLKNLTDEIKTYSLLLKELSKLKKAASLKETAWKLLFRVCIKCGLNASWNGK